MNDQLYSRGYPDMWSEQHPPIRFYSVLITHLLLEYLFNWVHVQQPDRCLSRHVERIAVGDPGGHRVFREGAGYAATFGGVERIACKANPAIPLPFAKDLEPSSSLVRQCLRRASAPLIGIEDQQMHMIKVVLGTSPVVTDLSSIEELAATDG